jgi:hypothetical protein
MAGTIIGLTKKVSQSHAKTVVIIVTTDAIAYKTNEGFLDFITTDGF